MESKNVTRIVKDGWGNLLTGLGMKGKDKRNGGQIQYAGSLPEAECEYLYAADDIGARIVDKLPDEACREWIELKMDDELEKKVSEELERLDVQGKFRLAWKWARLYGGSGLFINVADGRDLDQPIDMNRIREIKSLTLLNRHELYIDEVNIVKDITSPRFGQPETYRLSTSATRATNQGTRIHHSRIIPFEGNPLPRLLHVQNNYWADSVYTRLHDTLRDFGLAHGSVAHVIQDFRMAVYKVKGLADLIAAGEEEVIKKRLEIINLARSVIGAHLLDDEEEFKWETGSVQGLADLLDRVKARLQAATDIPHTILFNESPGASLGEGGSSERRIWYDHVASKQKEVLQKRLDYMLKLIFLAKKGPTRGLIPDEWNYNFRPLWQPSDKEKADVRKVTAETDRIYLEDGVLDPQEIRSSRFGGDEYSIETTIEIEEEANPLPLPEPKKEPSVLDPEPVEPEPAEDDPVPMDPKESLNGAQVTALLDIVARVKSGEINRDQAIALITRAFPIQEDGAAKILGDELAKEPG